MSNLDDISLAYQLGLPITYAILTVCRHRLQHNTYSNFIITETMCGTGFFGGGGGVVVNVVNTIFYE